MYSVWQGLLANLAVVASIVTAWAHLRDLIGRFGKRAETIALGLIMGAGAALSMTLGFRLEPGLIFDMRAAPLAVAGFFGGPLAAALAIGPALLFRVAIGGSGTFVGCISIVSVTVFATVQHLLLGKRRIHRRDVVLLALGSALASLLSIFALPAATITSTFLADRLSIRLSQPDRHYARGTVRVEGRAAAGAGGLEHAVSRHRRGLAGLS